MAILRIVVYGWAQNGGYEDQKRLGMTETISCRYLSSLVGEIACDTFVVVRPNK